MHAMWRSRDLFKAWGDNLIGITNLQARLAARHLQFKLAGLAKRSDAPNERGSDHSVEKRPNR